MMNVVSRMKRAGLVSQALSFAALAVTLALGASTAQAGVFGLARFLEPDRKAVGFEPEVMMSSGGGVGANIRYQQGLTSLTNLHLLAGVGSEPRKMSLGGMVNFDFIPDVGSQPGAGVAVSGNYYRYPHRGQLDLGIVPYLQKTFYDGEGRVVNPFIAIPLGPEFTAGTYRWATQVALGAMFRKEKSRVNFVLEFGASIQNAENYVSGGVLYIP